jgi:circadian clock protein KaiC
MLNKEAEYTTGSPELDDLIGPILPNTMLLVAGHPGSGKTSLASQICYANMRLGKKCLYVTFYENKGKLYKNMYKIGVDFQSAEEKGFFKFVKLPVVSVESFLKEFASLVEREDIDVVVLDSINPVLELTEKREEHRAILLNFFTS